MSAPLKRYQLAVFDPCDESDPPEFIGPVFSDNAFDRLVMRLAVERFNRRFERREETYCLAAFPVPEVHKMNPDGSLPTSFIEALEAAADDDARREAA